MTLTAGDICILRGFQLSLLSAKPQLLNQHIITIFVGGMGLWVGFLQNSCLPDYEMFSEVKQFLNLYQHFFLLYNIILLQLDWWCFFLPFRATITWYSLWSLQIGYELCHLSDLRQVAVTVNGNVFNVNDQGSSFCTGNKSCCWSYSFCYRLSVHVSSTLSALPSQCCSSNFLASSSKRLRVNRIREH